MKNLLLKGSLLLALFTFSQSNFAQNQSRMVTLGSKQATTSKTVEYQYFEFTFVNNNSETAKNVTINFDFDAAKYDMSSLQVINASHPLELQADGGSVIGLIRNGNLGGPGGQGGVALKIRTLPTIPVGTTVTCEAVVLFEYEDTLVPLDATINTSSIKAVLSPVAVVDNSIIAYPIPADSNIIVSCNTVIKSVELLDQYNQVSETILADEPSKSFDISAKLDGVHYIRVTSDSGQKVIRIVKQ